jgi:ferric-dicitrate binding protein FerR (iron transport regulator)
VIADLMATQSKMSNRSTRIAVIRLESVSGEARVADEQIIALLQEIRDLQKLHVQNYQDALKNQQESIAIQRGAMRRQRGALFVLFVLLVGFMLLIFWSTHH